MVLTTYMIHKLSINSKLESQKKLENLDSKIVKSFLKNFDANQNKKEIISSNS